VAQGVGPEFETQYHKKEKKNPLCLPEGQGFMNNFSFLT
jgi:hypothetical protein